MENEILGVRFITIIKKGFQYMENKMLRVRIITIINE